MHSKFMIEHEKRGPLSDLQLNSLILFLTNYGELTNDYSEKVIFFDTKDFLSIGDFENGSARLSIKSDQKGTFLRIKEGNPSDTIRSEYSVKLENEDSQNLIYILSRLGLTHGFFRPTTRKDFVWGNLIISIKTNCVMGNHFELELIDSSLDFESSIENLIKEVPLKFWTIKEYKDRINNLLNTNPSVDLVSSKLLG